jgi:hypothetical protein
MRTFKSALELAKYIKSLNLTPLQEETLMYQGVRHFHTNGVYAISIH